MSHLSKIGSLFDVDTKSTAPVNNDHLVFNGTNWVPSAAATGYVWNITGLATNTFSISTGDTVDFGRIASTDNWLNIDTSTADKVKLGFTTAPTTGGSTRQVLAFNDTGDAWEWRQPLTIGSGSSSMLTFNTDSWELNVTQLLITDTTVDSTEVSITAYVASNYTVGNEHQEGDVIILTSATGGRQTWIHNGGTAGTIADFTQINSDGHLTSFDVVGDSGTTQTITEGNSLSILGANGLNTIASATDTITTELGGSLSKNTTITQSSFDMDFTMSTGDFNLTSTGAGVVNVTAPTGGFNLLASGGTATSAIFQNPAGTFATSITAGAQTGNLDYTLPIVAPTAGQVLSSSAAGVLSWSTASAGTFDITDGSITSVVTTGTDTIDFNNGFTVADVALTPRVELGGTIVQDTTFASTTFDLNWNSTTGGFNAVASGAGSHLISSVGGSINLTETTGDINLGATTGDITIDTTGAAGLISMQTGGANAPISISASGAGSDVTLESTSGVDDVILGGQRLDLNGTTQNLVTGVKVADYTIVVGTDSHVAASASSASITITLPASAELGDTYHVLCEDATTNDLSIAPSGSEEIADVGAGVNILVQNDYDSFTFVSNGSGTWWIR